METFTSITQVRPRSRSGSSIPSKCLFSSLLGESLGLGSAHLSVTADPSLSQQLLFPHLQALSALVPGVSQVDNKSDFLGKKPHRRHPGILKLRCVQLPKALTDAARSLLQGEKERGRDLHVCNAAFRIFIIYF